MNVILTLHQGYFSLQQKETITGNYNQSKCRIVEFSPNWSIYNTTPVPKVQGSLQKKGQKESQSQRKSFLCDCVALFFETDSFMTWKFCVPVEARWSVSLQGLPDFALSPSARVYRQVQSCLDFDIDAGDLNSDLCAYRARTLIHWAISPVDKFLRFYYFNLW